MKQTLYYVHDPMCSWCYAFKSVLKKLRDNLQTTFQVKVSRSELLPEIHFQTVIGGLAPDTKEVMPEDIQKKVQHAWRSIEQKCPEIRFNFDFWHKTTPIRSTYPACRALLAAKQQGLQFEQRMLEAIQTAYYQDAQNPALDETLFACDQKIGLQSSQFKQDYTSALIEQQLQAELQLTRKLNVSSFPSLRLEVGTSVWPIAIDYRDEYHILEEIESLLS
ncbi:MAG: DsbA family protein [Candidatus Parabeggiatoa sp. nov. 3]|nr:MAG: DsbA family protein [Gammaproteobacteria bacterium]RKZ66801.1 MAG: DsbA family protein [Gammaproteobacteria bacterium]RKZ89163.1 MAG: DsbA family protein [Gammaproteobacteria bacterium]